MAAGGARCTVAGIVPGTFIKLDLCPALKSMVTSRVWAARTGLLNDSAKCPFFFERPFGLRCCVSDTVDATTVWLLPGLLREHPQRALYPVQVCLLHGWPTGGIGAAFFEFLSAKPM